MQYYQQEAYAKKYQSWLPNTIKPHSLCVSIEVYNSPRFSSFTEFLDLCSSLSP